MKSTLQRLSKWYSAQCNGDWEHDWGFKISTLDNPGVAVEVNLDGTLMADVPFEEKKEKMESTDGWMICRRVGSRFEGAGAPSRLEDILVTFLDWTEQNEKKGYQDGDRNEASCP